KGPRVARAARSCRGRARHIARILAKRPGALACRTLQDPPVRPTLQTRASAAMSSWRRSCLAVRSFRLRLPIEPEANRKADLIRQEQGTTPYMTSTFQASHIGTVALFPG